VKEDMFAHKLMAMTERIAKTSRDIYIYDVRYFVKKVGDLLNASQKDSTRATLKEDTLFLLRMMLENTRSSNS